MTTKSTSKGNPLGFFRLLEEFNILQDNYLLNRGISAFEFYNFVKQAVENLIGLVSAEHFREPHMNPRVIFDYSKTDVLGNPSSVRIAKRRTLIQPRRLEVAYLREVQQLLTLFQNEKLPEQEDLQAVLRDSPLERSMVEYYHRPRQESRQAKKKRKSKRNSRHYWWLRRQVSKTRDQIQQDPIGRGIHIVKYD